MSAMCMNNKIYNTDDTGDSSKIKQTEYETRESSKDTETSEEFHEPLAPTEHNLDDATSPHNANANEKASQGNNVGKTTENEVSQSSGYGTHDGLRVFIKGPLDQDKSQPMNDESGVVQSAWRFPDCPHYYLSPLDDVPDRVNISDNDVELLHTAHHPDPFGVLGAHQYDDIIVVRAWIRNARNVFIKPHEQSMCVFKKSVDKVEMIERCSWLFQKAFKIESVNLTEEKEKANEEREKWNANIYPRPPMNEFLYNLHVHYHNDASDNEYVIRDCYNFGVVCSIFDLNLFQSGSCWHVDNFMGSHVITTLGTNGVKFVVWAPNALFVSVVGDWNSWDGRVNPMRKRHSYGVWELFIPHLVPHTLYGYQIHPDEHTSFIKIDPYAQEFENPPKHASVITGCDDPFKEPSQRYVWNDGDWMKKRIEMGTSDSIRRQPMSIYEIHLPSWMRGEGNRYLGYREIAPRLVQHIKNLNFTHVEFLPVSHHPFEGSWGYQISGCFAPYSRLGSADDFKYLVDQLHQNDIGVFLDFVVAHFCKDSWGLASYDGAPCFEYSDPREGEHKTWGTLVFNFRRNEVRSFLLGAAYHWLRRYHIDGLRIDAVSSMLYKNYLRKQGEWIPNEVGGDANLQAISLLQELNWVVHSEFPGVYMMAEESTSWQGITGKDSGLGFDAKWDLGWMNDTLEYLCLSVDGRPSDHSKLTFRGLYVEHEKWILPLSHDEVVNGKGSLLDKCGCLGSPYEDRIKTLRALYAFQFGIPGRPLIFMGGEFGQGREWEISRSIDWHESCEDLRSKICIWLSDLANVYRHHKALFAGDDEHWNFKWIDCDNASDCIIAWLRSYQHWYNDIACLCNFSSTKYYRYPVGVPHGGQWKVLLNSDDWRYGGAMHGPGNMSTVHTTQGGRPGWPYCLWIDVPAFGAIYLQAPQPAKDDSFGD